MLLSVSNLLSVGGWELDEVPALRDPADLAQIGGKGVLSQNSADVIFPVFELNVVR